jgi:hypothetical protein
MGLALLSAWKDTSIEKELEPTESPARGDRTRSSAALEVACARMGVAVIATATTERSDAAGSATDAAVLGSRRCRAISYMSSCAGRTRHVMIS